ncbi:hypothetical protein [Luteolibacter luteus]|uniref:Uncharacterized protein n=1 Tax=Luteolibacter luteus TaxID=2728835 RepID=A0A858RGT2_9BACT|nr:hypothetical protein [Luteolibacter luteus]QJE96002.1 hypothetical protein HHL09_09470 [Luteolibacter luteus]
MNAPQIAHVEFYGGPEDGRVIDAEVFRDFQMECGGMAQVLPLMIRDETRSGSELELIGYYVMENVKRGTLRYRWEFAE